MITIRNHFDGHSVQFVFENGLNFSMIQQSFSHSSNENVEIAVLNKDEEFITRDFIENLHDDVKGWVSADEAVQIMNKVRKA